MIGSLGELASMPGMPSEPTLRKLIDEHPDFPIRSRGKNGVSYEIDLVEAATYVTGLRQAEEEKLRARSATIRQLGLDLLGGDSVAAVEGAALTPAERKALLEEELVAIKVAERRGELVRKASIEAALAAFMMRLQRKGESFSARLARRIELSRDQIAAIDAMMRQDLREQADELERLAHSGDGGASEGGDNVSLQTGADPAV